MTLAQLVSNIVKADAAKGEAEELGLKRAAQPIPAMSCRSGPPPE